MMLQHEAPGVWAKITQTCVVSIAVVSFESISRWAIATFQVLEGSKKGERRAVNAAIASEHASFASRIRESYFFEAPPEQQKPHIQSIQVLS